MTDEVKRPAVWPSHEALWPTDLFTRGVGWVILTRSKSAGRRVETGVFLIDVFCLGAKLAVYEDSDAQDYQRRIRDHYADLFPMVPTEPCCARKLVEGSVQYAKSLGFAPHPDYKKAARVWGGLKAKQCPQEFTFGHEGKPFYRRGPRETEAQARRILWQLEQRCGTGTFEYDVMLGTAEEIDGFLGF